MLIEQREYELQQQQQLKQQKLQQIREQQQQKLRQGSQSSMTISNNPNQSSHASTPDMMRSNQKPKVPLIINEPVNHKDVIYFEIFTHFK